ncbi:MAG: citrate synthase [Gammaproteobacteria bacterium]|nr:MAG: citrate synthase [Gammaproteobacteria bacterium]
MSSEYLPGLAGVPATKSNISSIDGEKGILAYRGYDITELADKSTFEETALLLLDGCLPSQAELDDFDRQLRSERRLKYKIRSIMKNLPTSGHPMEMLQTAVASLGMFYGGEEVLSDGISGNDVAYIHRMSVKIISRMATIVAMWEHVRKGYDPIEPRDDLSHAANFLYMLNGKEPEPLAVKIMDACLVLHAEHTINASTFAAMVCSSTLASPFLVVAAAIGTLAGPLHGGANQRVVEMLREIGRPENANGWLRKQLAENKVVWGMGHREYQTKDPRATVLQKLMVEWGESQGNLSPEFETALVLEEACEEALGPKGVYPNVDYYSGILYTEMGIAPDQFTPIFAISRVAGWLAHWREQLSDNRIFRPTQIYTGEGVRGYKDMSQR